MFYWKEQLDVVIVIVFSGHTRGMRVHNVISYTWVLVYVAAEEKRRRTKI
jgi:hypothetical protein